MNKILIVMILILSVLIVGASNNESMFVFSNITSNIVVSESSKYHIEIDCQYLMDNPNLNYEKIDLYTDFCKTIFPNITQSKIKCNFEVGDIVREESQWGNRFDGGLVCTNCKAVYHFDGFKNKRKLHKTVKVWVQRLRR